MNKEMRGEETMDRLKVFAIGSVVGLVVGGGIFAILGSMLLLLLVILGVVAT